jgi:hypothetical protein
VSGNGAYPEEMNEALVFMDALRAAVPAESDPRLGATLVPRLAATARASTLAAETVTMRSGTAPATRAARRPRSRLASVARVAIAIALIPLVLAGLAVAGVTVPSPARSAFDSVGITLPNQPGKQGESGANPQSSEAPTADQGGTGASGAQGAGSSGSAHPNSRAKHAQDKAKATGRGHGKAVGRGKALGRYDLAPSGRSGQTSPSTHSNAGGSSASHFPEKAPSPRTRAPKAVAERHAKTPPGDAE